MEPPGVANNFVLSKINEMKKIFSADTDNNNIHLALLILRVGVGLLMLSHGIPKMAGLVADGPVQFPSVFGFGAELSLTLAVFAEVICSVLLIVGFGTRIASVPLIVTMVVAVFFIHANDPFARQEMGLHYLLGYVMLLIAGAGKYSIDYLLVNKRIPAGKLSMSRS